MDNILVVGGFTESKRLLEPVAEEAIKYGFGNDASVMTLREATKMDEERLRSATAGAKVITHSAGITALPDARKRITDSELPEDVVIVAGPEPRRISYLAEMALWKTLDHVFGQTPQSSKAHMRVVRGNFAETIAHPLVTASLVPAISRFSTKQRLTNKALCASGRIGNFMMFGDAFYDNHDWQEDLVLQSLMNKGCVVGEFSGGHDELLVEPGKILRRVRNMLNDTDRELRLID